MIFNDKSILYLVAKIFLLYNQDDHKVQFLMEMQEVQKYGNL
jgi:hypothetical protein